MTAAVRWTLLTCLVAALSYSGAVTTFALLAFVLPSALVVGLVGAYNRSSPGKALLVVLPTALVVAEVVNLVSGNDQGPAARSAFVAAFGAGAAVGLTRVGPALLPPLALIVLGALSFGAGREVGYIAVATASVATMALASSEQERRRLLGRPPQSMSRWLVPLVVGAVGWGVLGVQNSVSTRDAYVPFPAVIDAAIRPQLALSSVPQTAPSEPAASKPRPGSATRELGQRRPSALVLVWGLLLLPLGLAVRLLVVAWSWARLKRRLRECGPAGPWLWALSMRQRFGCRSVPSESPDVVAEHAANIHPLGELGAMTASALFGFSAESHEQSWALARAVQDQLRRDAPWWRTWSARLTTPPKLTESLAGRAGRV